MKNIKMKNTKKYLSIISLLALTACDTSYAWESITGERPDQVVDGPRRTPVLNKTAAASKLPPMLETVAPSAPAASSSVSVMSNPYEQYNPEQPQQNATVALEDNSKDNGNFFTRAIGLDEAKPQPQNQMVQAGGEVARKPIAGNPYYAPETSPTAPLPAPAVAVETPKLSSVPEKPKQLDVVKSQHQQKLGELETVAAVAGQDKQFLDKEVAAPVPAPVNPETKQEDTMAKLTPLVKQPEPEAKIAPLGTPSSPPVPVASLPEVSVEAASEPATSPVARQVTSDAAPIVGDYGYKSAASLLEGDAAAAPLPSTNIIKTMRPSRYEVRSTTSHSGY